jgi:hypothetical protein
MIHVAFRLLVDNARFVNKQYRSQVSGDITNTLTAFHYAVEYGTVVLNVGRQTGKTTYIVDHATKDDLVIVPNVRASQSFSECPADILIAGSLIDNFKGNRYNNIYIDEPRYVDKKLNIDQIYFTFARDYTQTFILLGTM